MTPLSEGNTNSTSTSTSSPSVPENLGTGELVVTYELGVPRFKAPSPFLAGRANFVAAENYPQPSLEARGNSLRQQGLPKASSVKAVPSKPGMTYITTESRQWHTIRAADCVSIIASLKEDDNVTEALSNVTRTRRSNSLVNNSGSFRRIRQNHWMVIHGLEDMRRTRPNKIGFEYCIDNSCNPQYPRAVQGRSGRAKLDAKLQGNIHNSLCVDQLFLHHVGFFFVFAGLSRREAPFAGGISSNVPM